MIGISLSLTQYQRAFMAGGPVPAFSLAQFFDGATGYLLDVSNASTISQDVDGALPVSAAGQTVARIEDVRGQTTNFIQATEASRPVYQIDGTGRAYLMFDGVNDSLSTSAAFNPGANNKAQVFIGLRDSVAASDQLIWETGTDSDVNGRASIMNLPVVGNPLLQTRAYTTRGTATRAQRSSVAATPLAGNSVVVALLDNSALTTAAQIAVSVNGLPIVSSGDVGPTSNGNYSAADAHHIGRRNNLLFPFSGRIYQVLVRFGPELSPEMLASAAAMVANKTGVTL